MKNLSSNITWPIRSTDMPCITSCAFVPATSFRTDRSSPGINFNTSLLPQRVAAPLSGKRRRKPNGLANVIAARRERIDPTDEAFVTCASCGSDQIISASKIVRKGSIQVSCSECNATWTALVDNAMSVMGTKLIVEGMGGVEDGKGEMAEMVRNMGVKLFVGGLAPRVDSGVLKSTMEQFGEVREAKVVYDKVTGRSRGFGFVTMVGKSAAGAAIDVLSGDSSTILGRRLKVREANE